MTFPKVANAWWRSLFVYV